jgi:HSP20 family protein
MIKREGEAKEILNMANLVRRSPYVSGSGSEAAFWDPFRIMFELAGEHARDGGAAPVASFHPTFEVYERKDGYVFKADLPGIKQEDLEITLTEKRLSISGKREAEERIEGDKFYAYERSYGSFTRTFSLPDGVDADHVVADLKDGVLSLVVPKRPEVQPKKINIKTNVVAKQ